MDQKIVDKLRELDLLVQLPGGKRGVPVSLQILSRVSEGSRHERRQELIRRFEQIARQLGPEGGSVDLNSVSPSAQIAEAVLPLDALDRLENQLAEQDVRVDPLVDRQIV